MKKFTVLLIATIFSVASAFAQSVWDGTHTTWTKGAGTESSPYLIENAAQLAHLAYEVNNGINANAENIVGAGKYWKLTINVNLNSLEWSPIGEAYQYFFGGHFDGEWHTIANLVTSGKQYAGFFGQMNGGSVKNIGIVGTSSVTAMYSGGGIVGYANGNFTINNCYNTSNVSVSSGMSSSGGGIVGYASGDYTINNCYNTGDISSVEPGGIIGYANGDFAINNCYNIGSVFKNVYPGGGGGGIVGCIECNDAIISYCYNTGNISATYFIAQSVGGIVGSLFGNVIINNCYNTGNVLSPGNAGGIVGDAEEDGDYAINNCYNTGDISSTNKASGGIIGRTYGDFAIDNCYNTGSVYGLSVSVSGGIVGAIFDSPNVIINNCYNTGNVSSDHHGGGIVGQSSNTIINNCYNTGNVLSPGDAGGIVGFDFCGATISNCYYLNTSAPNSGGGISQTSTFMKTQEFVDLLNNGPVPNSAYKLDDLLINDDYPILKWQTEIATLFSLTVSEGVLTPTFSSNVFSYTVGVACSINSITITATPTHPDATVVGAGEKQLAIGTNQFTITVTAADGVTTLNYVVTVNHYLIPAINITDVPSYAEVGKALPLTGIVEPDEATNQTIIWSVANAGTTGAIITNNVFFAISEGVAIVTATITAGADCETDYEQSFFINVGNIGIVEVDNKSSLRVYPNPTNGELLIEYEQQTIDNAEYSIYNLVGQMVMQGKLSDETTTINVELLASGMYFLKIAEKTVKFVKQ